MFSEFARPLVSLKMPLPLPSFLKVKCGLTDWPRATFGKDPLSKLTPVVIVRRQFVTSADSASATCFVLLSPQRATRSVACRKHVHSFFPSPLSRGGSPYGRQHLSATSGAGSRAALGFFLGRGPGFVPPPKIHRHLQISWIKIFREIFKNSCKNFGKI